MIGSKTLSEEQNKQMTTRTLTMMAEDASIAKQEKRAVVEEHITHARDETTFGWRSIMMPQKTAEKLKQTLLTHTTTLAYSYSVPGLNSIVASTITLDHSNEEI